MACVVEGNLARSRARIGAWWFAMKVLLAAGALLAAAFLASELVRYKRRIPFGFRALLYTYGEFLLLGYLLGPEELEWLSADFVKDLQPFVALGIGMVGLLYGLQFDWKTIKRFSVRPFVLAIVQAFVTFVVVFAAFFGLFAWLGWGGGVSLAAAFAAIASMTAPTAISIIVLEDRPKGPNSDLLRVIASVDGLVGVVLFNLTLAWINPSPSVVPAAAHVVNALCWFGLSCGFGALTGLLLCLLFDRRSPPGEMAIYLIGVIVFASGIAWSCGMSPLFVLLIAGAILANYSHRSEQVYSVLGKLELPAFITLLILVGAQWKPNLEFAPQLILAYILFRTGGKLIGFYLGAKAVRLPVRPYPALGLGLLSQGGLALAMIANLAILANPGGYDSNFLQIQTVVLFSILANEFVTPVLTRRALRKAGEL